MDTLSNAGRNLLSFDFGANTDHIKDFEWSTLTFLCIYESIFARSFSLCISCSFPKAKTACGEYFCENEKIDFESSIRVLVIDCTSNKD